MACPRTLGDLLQLLAANTPTAPAVVFADQRLDYGALKRRVDEFARCWRSACAAAIAWHC
jgi:non-ribosomal peptide synthetase component E (peptide arylation enzyme)